jgi:hypothetical protein
MRRQGCAGWVRPYQQLTRSEDALKLGGTGGRRAGGTLEERSALGRADYEGVREDWANRGSVGLLSVDAL